MRPPQIGHKPIRGLQNFPDKNACVGNAPSSRPGRECRLSRKRRECSRPVWRLQPMDDFQGRVAFVTGAASGIGLGIATALTHAGARVALADKRGEKVAAAAAALQKQGATTLAVELDVTDRAAWARCADHVERELGNVS